MTIKCADCGYEVKWQQMWGQRMYATSAGDDTPRCLTRCGCSYQVYRTPDGVKCDPPKRGKS